MNIVIVGFMGTGKTVVAKELAKKLKMQYISMDREIEKKEDKTISQIFSRDGEPHFRRVEKEVAKELSQKANLVIDAGGGVVLDGENIKNLKKGGIIVCLNATPEIIYERTKKHSHRPLLNVDNPKKKIQELLKSRAPFYKKADFQIDTSSKSIKQVVREVERLIV